MTRPTIEHPIPDRSPVRTMLPLAVLAVAAALVPADASAQAQATTGVVRGTVRDPAGEPVAGAVVVIEHRETGLRTTVETTTGGTFARTLLPLGTYDVTATAPGGFGRDRREGLVLRLGGTLLLALVPGPVELEGITVTRAPGTVLDAEDVTSSQRFSEAVVDGLPSNGRNFLDFTLLTPGVSISQGPDGDELNVSGQRGIFNNFIVDGADFNNAFFGEQRGGQRPAFTFNQDAIEEIVVVNQGATAEFGRSAGGFVNVVTRSGTNDFSGTAHLYGQWDGIAAAYPAARGGGKPEFGRGQFGFTLGGPVVRDRAFFFLAYDQQGATETKQRQRRVRSEENLEQLGSFLRARWPGLFDDEFGPIERTDDARALIAKLDLTAGERHQASFKYNYTWSEQVNGTFDVDSWGRSANGIERDYSHAINASIRSLLGNTVSNEFRFQWAGEQRPRWYGGPLIPGAELPGPPQFARLGGRPFPDIAMDFADGFRIGLPFFLPIDPGYDGRIQLVDNVSYLSGAHLFKAGVEYNRTTVEQQFIGFANSRYIFDSVDGFMGFATHGGNYVTCSDGSESRTGACPAGSTVTGPVLTYLQSATVPGVPAERLGLQTMATSELAFFVQDTWKPTDRLTLNLGVRWEGAWHPDVFVEPGKTFYAPYLDDPRFPSDGTIPDDLDNIQPRFGLVWDADGGRTFVRLNAGAYTARIPGLVFAQYRTTNGAFQQILFRSSADAAVLGPVPAIDEQIDTAGVAPFLPDIHVADRNLELPRTWSFSAEATRSLSTVMTASVSYQHARTDGLFRFVDRNAPALGSPFGIGTHPSGGGINALTVGESTARSRYHGITAGIRGEDAAGGFAFDVNYTLSFDRSDDDNERDPFIYRYADPRNLEAEYGWSDRDRRHQFNGYFVHRFASGIRVSHLFRQLTASPVSARCADPGQRAAEPADRICADGTVLQRNTLRRDNGLFTWDLRISREFVLGGGIVLEPVLEIFNLTNEDNFLDTAHGSLLFNFDGTIQSGLGDTRRAQVGGRVQF
ncbi:MAG: TonB-dependent receptor [Gammaproteobacteria bacterium]|nr:TonB-dependent receptor [Gammaproteobacteria bacterium]